MKKFIGLFLSSLLAVTPSFAADVKISQLPLGSGATVGANDSFPYVASGTNVTKRLKLYDLVNLPIMVSTYAPILNPVFVGGVTAPNFTGNLVGNVTGNADTATALAANPEDCSAGQYASAIAANGNLSCSAVSTSQLSGSVDLTTQVTGVLPTANGGTGVNSTATFPSSGTLVTRTATETLTNKDIDGGTAANNRRITLPKNTTANLTALTRKEATIVYDTDVKNILYDNGTDLIPVGSGTGGGGVNYILNPDAEINTQGWATYVNGTGSNPTTGTGGTANVTFTRSTSTPLVGKASFLFSKGAVSRIGEGFSYDFTIPSLSKGQQLAINYGYQILPSSGTFNSGDLKVWIYDVTNARLIQPSAFQVMGSIGPTVAQPLVFQAASDSTSYRLIFHVSTANAANWDILFDSFSVGPQVVPVGAAVTDTVSYAPQWTSSGTLPTIGDGAIIGRWWRYGDRLRAQIKVVVGSTTSLGTGDYYFSIPSSLTPDITKMTSTAGGNDFNAGVGVFYDSGSAPNSRVGVLLYNTTNPGVVRLYMNATGTMGASATGLGGAGDQINLNVDVPIVGWSSNTVVSDSAASRPVNMRNFATPNSAVANGIFTKVTWANGAGVWEDSVGAWNPVTGVYTVKVPGSYQWNANFEFVRTGGTATQIMAVRAVSGSQISVSSGNWSAAGSEAKGLAGGGLLSNLKAGDQIQFEIRVDGSAGLNFGTNFTGGNGVSLQLVQGPSQIQAATKIASSYSTASGQSIGSGGASTIVNYDSKREDLTGSVTTGAAWRFTAPSPGTFSVKAKAQIGAFAGTATVYLSIFKNGVEYSRGPLTTTFGTSQNWTASIEDDVPMNEGEYLDIRIWNGTTSTTLFQSSLLNTVAISRNGGVN